MVHSSLDVRFVHRSAGPPPVDDEALDLAQRLASAADAGRVDLLDLGRRARRLLARTTSAVEGPEA